MNTPKTPHKQNYSTERAEDRLASRRIVLAMTYEQYEASMATSQKARACLTEQMEAHPELFPTDISPAHKLNGFVYRDNWLENLLVASSC
jgi:hypothetical protein